MIQPCLSNDPWKYDWSFFNACLSTAVLLLLSVQRSQSEKKELDLPFCTSAVPYLTRVCASEKPEADKRIIA
jgi:hypothetical protein